MSGERPTMVLLAWERIDKGALVGRASIRLPNQLEIADIAIFTKDGRRWAQLPSEPVRGREGEVLKDERGKARYRSPLKWASRSLQESFSERLIDLVEAEHGALDDGAGR